MKFKLRKFSSNNNFVNEMVTVDLPDDINIIIDDIKKFSEFYTSYIINSVSQKENPTQDDALNAIAIVQDYNKFIGTCEQNSCSIKINKVKG